MRRKRIGRSDGQALVEFALVLPLFLIVVVGVIQFGRAITFWLDLNDSAQTAVRFAVTNRYPGCDESSSTACTGDLSGFTNFAKDNLNSSGLKANTTVTICYVNTDANTALSNGDTLRMTMTSPFSIAGVLNINMTLRGRATMRMEQTISATNPTRIGPVPTC